MVVYFNGNTMKIKPLHILVAILLGLAGSWLILRLEERPNQAPPNYDLIEEGLYQGGHQKEPPPGTTAVLNLCEREDSYRAQVHRWESIPDRDPAPSIDWLREMVTFVDTQRQAGRTTYVHCMAGISRSGMVTTAYLMFKNDWTRDQALEFVRSKRPQTRPNPAFMELLLEWECELQNTPTSK